ncbi:MAG: hypothetical protein KGQ41_05390 [Alphaproteobacteria bacterium]|nr:hypothetical protein [Alphaproteobacteria bacterium]
MKKLACAALVFSSLANTAAEAATNARTPRVVITRVDAESSTAQVAIISRGNDRVREGQRIIAGTVPCTDFLTQEGGISAILNRLTSNGDVDHLLRENGITMEDLDFSVPFAVGIGRLSCNQPF